MDSAPHVSEIPAKFQSNLDPLEDNILAIFMIVIGKHDCDCNYLLLCISYMLRYCLKLKLQSKGIKRYLFGKSMFSTLTHRVYFKRKHFRQQNRYQSHSVISTSQCVYVNRI